MDVLAPTDVLADGDEQALDVRGVEQRFCDGNSSSREQRAVQP